MTQPSPFPLGRVEGPEDPRDRDYPMALALDATATPPPSKYWYPGLKPLNQGTLGACVAFTGENWLQNSPIRSAASNEHAFATYWECKAIDGIPDIEGTYARVLLKVLQSHKKVGRYLWATSPADIKNWVLLQGPVMVGTPWLDGMFTVNADGFVNVSGYEFGGHEYLVRGYSKPRDAYLCRNSWGEWWGIGRGSAWYGNGGEFWIKRTDLENLIFSSWGDAVGVEEI